MSSEAPAVRLFFRQAIARALAEEMQLDPNVIVLGQDVGPFGGSYKEFAGLYERFGAERVRDTPVSEAGMIGLGVGAAAAGLRPLVSITYMDFLMLGFDPLINYAAKLRYKTGGQLRAPIIIKTTAGAKGQGVAHSQCIESWLMSVAGLKVVAPSNPTDAYGLIKSAFRQEGPVVYIDHKRLFPMAGDVPIHETAVPIGKAIVRRTGHDVTLGQPFVHDARRPRGGGPVGERRYLLRSNRFAIPCTARHRVLKRLGRTDCRASYARGGSTYLWNRR